MFTTAGNTGFRTVAKPFGKLPSSDGIVVVRHVHGERGSAEHRAAAPMPQAHI